MSAQRGIQTSPILVLGYGSLLSAVAGFVNAVAILVLAFPVGNLTATTTKFGMGAVQPVLYESAILGLVVLGFLMGAAISGAVLAPARTHAGMRHATVMVGEAVLLVFAIVVGQHTVAILFAATACGIQNGATSSLRAMAIRTTHFTGTVTDLGLLLGRSRHHGFDKWRILILAGTVVTFVIGSVVGTVVGAYIGDVALLVPAAVCVMIAVAGLGYDRWRSTRVAVAPAPSSVAVPAPWPPWPAPPAPAAAPTPEPARSDSVTVR